MPKRPPANERNIKRLPKGRYFVRLWRGGELHTATLDTIEQAREFRDTIALDHHLVKRGLPAIVQPRHTLLALIDQYLDAADERVQGNTASTYREQLRSIEVWLREVERRPQLGAEQLTDQHIAAFVRWRRTHRLSAQARRDASDAQVRKTLRKLLDVYRWHRIEPGWRIPSLASRASTGKRVLEEEQLRKWLGAMARGSLERTVAEWAVRSGMRPGELYALRWADVDRQRGMAVVQSLKHGPLRLVPITATLLRHLSAWEASPERVPSVDGRVFTINGRPLGPWSLKKRLRAASRAAGIEPPLESLGWGRNLFIGLGLGEATAYTVAKAVGHADISTTMGYTRGQVPVAKLAELGEALDRILGAE
ncbi:MAG TPA: tyrosine-type recombinase/integrase [Thermoanaerobaculia bacterium]|nr:tyrosine-type recombinase/integrase [Thermoanaerobaculia bacterium]